MKSVILILFLCTVSLLPAQSVNWTAPGNNWTYSGIGWVREDRPQELYVDRDTVIDGLNATILEQRSDDPYTRYNFDSFDTIIVRQEGAVFYQYLDTAFRVLYDFDLEVGDTVRRYVPRAIRNRDTSIAFMTFRVDSVGMLRVGESDLRGQFLRWIDVTHAVDGALAEGWFYELLGSPNSYLLPYGYFYCDGQCPRFLRCFSSVGGDGNTGLTYEDQNFPFPCDTVINSLRTPPDISRLIQLAPNPVRAGRELTLTLDAALSAADTQLLLIDASGRQIIPSVSRGTDQLRVTLPTLTPAGLYTLILQTSAGRAALRLVVLPPG